MQSIGATVPDTLRDQTNALLPLRWSMFSHWLKEHGEDGVSFEQRLEVVSAEGETLVAQDAQFVIEKNTYSQVVNVFGLPVKAMRASETIYDIRVLIRRTGSPNFTFVADYPLSVTISFGEPVPANR